MKKKEDIYRSIQQIKFNQWHQAHELPVLHPGGKVWTWDQDRHGHIVKTTEHPRSYIVKSKQGIVRGNMRVLVHTTNEPESPKSKAQSSPVKYTPESTDTQTNTQISLQVPSKRIW